MRKIMRWELAGLLFTLIFGSLLHFFYQRSGNLWQIGIFAPVNESSWEHLKLIFTPMLLFSAVEYFAVGRKTLAFLPIKVLSVLLAMCSILVLFYTYSGIVGTNFLVADILTFVLAAIIAYRYSSVQFSTKAEHSKAETFCALITLAVLIVCFVLFTFCPPHLGLFIDPVSGTYGIPRG